MQIVTSRGNSPLELITYPSPRLRDGEVRVRVRAIGVNPVDWKMRGGDAFLGFMQRLIGPRGPLVVGIDFAGDVLEVGAKAEGLKVGDRVVGGTNFARGQFGSYADEVVVRPDQCAVLPPAVTFEDAACLPVAAVSAFIALAEHRKIEPGMRVLVLGASGGVGLFSVQLAHMFGAHVAGVCSTRNVALVERFGASAIDYTKGAPLEAAKAHGPYDLIIHAVGTAVYPLDACRELLAPGGLVDLVMVRSADYGSIAASSFRAAFGGKGVKRVRTLLGRPTRARLEPLVDALARGDIEPIVEERFRLSEAEQAHARSRSGKVVGKLLLLP